MRAASLSKRQAEFVSGWVGSRVLPFSGFVA